MMKNSSLLLVIALLIGTAAQAQSAKGAYQLHCQVMAFQAGKGFQVVASDDQAVKVEEFNIGPDTGGYSPQGTQIALKIKSQAGEEIQVQGSASV